MHLFITDTSLHQAPFLRTNMSATERLHCIAIAKVELFWDIGGKLYYDDNKLN